MKDTDAYEQDAIVPNRAVGYTREGADGKPQPGPRRVNIYALPGALELGRRRLLDGRRTCSPSTARCATTSSCPPSGRSWFFSDQRPARGRRGPIGGARASTPAARGFAGGTAGVNAVIEIDLDTGYTVVVLSNDDPPSAESVAKKIRQWLGLN